jgi:hypothetical protein
MQNMIDIIRLQVFLSFIEYVALCVLKEQASVIGGLPGILVNAI